MTRHRQPILVAFALALFLSACDNTFSPKTEFKEELIVACVLDNTQTMQVVRLGTTYDAELGNVEASRGRSIAQADVKIREGGNLYQFKDTLVTLSDGSEERIWINRDLIPTPHKQYRLQVVADGYPEATAALSIPSAAIARLQVKHTALKIDSVVLYSGAINFVVQPKGFYNRLVLVYRDTLDGQIIDKRAEVPIDEAPFTGDPIYPQIGREKVQGYPSYLLNKTLYSLTEDKSRFDRVGAIGYMYTVDSDFYNYFKIVRGFDDPRSVRLDQPDYTNINGARGIFGSAYRDTAYTQLYKFFRP